MKNERFHHNSSGILSKFMHIKIYVYQSACVCGGHFFPIIHIIKRTHTHTHNHIDRAIVYLLILNWKKKMLLTLSSDAWRLIVTNFFAFESRSNAYVSANRVIFNANKYSKER